MRSTLALLMCFLSACWSPAGSAQIKLFVSVLPLKHFVERVGGEHVDVESMVQPGHSPATYEPTPRQMADLAEADAFVRIGAPFETVWMERIEAANPGLMVIDVRKGIELIPMKTKALDPGNAANNAHSHSHSGLDPHIWLDPMVVRQIAATVRDYLLEIDPVNRDSYESNTDRFIADLIELDTNIRGLTERAESRRFLVFHPAWGYFSRAYGLEQLAVEHEGKEPGPRALARLIEMVQREGISTIFVQKQFSDRIAATLAAEIGGRVVALDPLAEDYFVNLLEAARAISGSGDP